MARVLRASYDRHGARDIAPGVIAAVYALFTTPAVGRLIEACSTRGPDLPFALLMASHFPTTSFHGPSSGAS